MAMLFIDVNKCVWIKDLSKVNNTDSREHKKQMFWGGEGRTDV